MIVRRHPAKGPRRRRFAVALLLGALLALVVPALAAAAKFEVTGTGDTSTVTACETEVGECTLRGAVDAANATATEDEIGFDPGLGGGTGGTIVLGSQLTIERPVKITGNLCASVPCVKLQRSSGYAIYVGMSHAVIEHLAIESGADSIGVFLVGGEGSDVLENSFTVTGAGTSAAIETGGTISGAGNLIEGNQITVAQGFNWGIDLPSGPNRVFGNQIEGAGGYYTGIWVEGSSGNQIGGDTAARENVITGFANGSIRVTTGGNEVGRNRGSGGNEFLHAAGSTPAPTIVTVQQPKVTGTAAPGATVRVFSTESEFLNEVEGFVGKATADGSGNWEVSLAGVPVGKLVTATQTLAGDTSGLSATAAVTAEPPSSGGGGEIGGGGGTTAPVTMPTPIQITASAPTKPTVKITKGPKKSSTATKATFKFKATNVSGAKFECKLDGVKWTSCRSPKTYKGLKAKKHTFQVRAKAAGVTGAATKYSFTVEP